MICPETRVVLLGVFGLLVSLYALHVETKLADPFYVPACNTSWGSCAAVFGSEYAHLLSKWGLVAKGSALDFSLATMGAFNYSLYIFYPFWPRSTRATLLILLATASCLFSVYLLYVLKSILKDFCIVCTTFHCINFSLFSFGALPEFRSSQQKLHPK
uniref:vitamin-K-epoxide reductase (warfarin-sensitive) n=1 Tax=Aureoumbra lagunensis TaxID=44058 RepID=A0A7S3K6R5_9STRA|mmetsp:Transcript_4306/g.6091  ORF Transcript_4306/g.6091 Transcript_4306/m.6091 type:complete len:158 (-) Transcript_4306:11-484(-)